MEDNDTIAITETPYWKKRHKNIEQGLLNDKDIKIHKLIVGYRCETYNYITALYRSICKS